MGTMNPMGNTAPAVLPDGLLEELIAELDDALVVGIVLGGSYARGTATALSDVDLAPFVREEAQVRPKQYFYRHDRLISISWKSLAGVRASLGDPRLASRVVPGFREARVLLDKDGSLGRLLDDLARFIWEPLQEQANQQVSYMLLLLAEAVHKVANELDKGNDPAVAYTSEKMVAALTEQVVIQRGLLIQSDSTYYQQVQVAAGIESPWTACHRVATGLTDAPLHERAVASLRLYGLTLDLLRPALSAEHAAVAEEAARRAMAGRAGAPGDEWHGAPATRGPGAGATLRGH
jgi:predicted nucleotidyltransferase